MASNLRRPTFDGSPLDELQVVDVYNETAADVKNAFTSNHTAFAKSLTESIGNQRSDLASLFKDVREGEVGLKTGLDRTTDLLRGARGEIQNIKSSMKERINDVMNSPPVSTYKMVKTQVAGIQKTIRSADLKTVGGVVDMLNGVSGNELLTRFDIGAHVGLLTATLEEIDSWEVPEFVDSVMGYFKDEKGEEVVFLAVANSAPRLAYNGDIDTIEKILNHVDPASLTRDVPDFAQRLLRRYRFKNGETPADYPRRLTQLVNVLDQLQPNWFYIQRNGHQIYNFSVMQNVSADAKTLLATSDEHRIAVLTAPEYPPETANSILRSMYPLVPFSS